MKDLHPTQIFMLHINMHSSYLNTDIILITTVILDSISHHISLKPLYVRRETQSWYAVIPIVCDYGQHNKIIFLINVFQQ